MKAHISKRTSATLAAVVILGMSSLLATSCYYIPALGGRGVARATVSPSPLPPPNVTSIALIVGGPGMNTITQSIMVGAGTTTLSVPSGIGRTFTLLENTPSATLIGTATVDLSPGETKNIPLTPTAGASQIVVSDNLNNRLVQISDMSGTGWTTLSIASPYAVDFDEQARMYVASSASVVRMSDILDVNPPTTVGASTQGLAIKAIAVDRPRGLLYFTDGTTNLYSVQITPTVGTALSVSLTTVVPSLYCSVLGIAVDSDGFVYLTGTFTSISYTTVPEIVKIDPTTFSSPKIAASYTGSLSSPWDVLVNGNYVYVSDFGAKQIVRFDKNLNRLDSISGYGTDSFLGPERFVAILNKPITVIDEAVGSGPGRDRIVSFNDMTGAGWTTYGSTATVGAGPPPAGQFTFYIP